MNWHNVLLRPQNLYEELLRRKLISGGGVPAVLQTVTGISPLTLLNVASKGIKSLTQFGKCEQASTPTPSVPVDIKCNNGALKWDSVNHRIYADGTPEVLSITAEDEYEGDIVTFDLPRLMNIGKLSVNLEPVQAGSGDPSPDNVRPISGHTSVNVIVSPTLNPLDGTTYPITLGQTVYSGTLDVTTGVLTSNYGVVDMGSLEWTKVTDSGKDRFYATVPDMVSATVRTLNVLSSIYKTNIGGAWDEDKTVYNGGGSNRVYVRDSNYTEVSVFKTAVTGQTIAYPLAEPLTYQIDPVTVHLLIGENNIWSDAGAIYIVVERTAKQTAAVTNLFAVGDYKDEQEIISGDVTHKVGLWVLNGRELWELNSVYGKTDNAFLSRNVVPFAQNSKTLLCTHFVNKESVETSGNVSAGVFAGSQISFFCGKNSNINSVDAWKIWLAAQYANGTPVVVVYPLAEATTEQVTAQHLTARDTATITAQTNNISDISLEIKYWQKAE